MTVHSYCEGASEPFLKRPFIWRSSCFASAWQAAQFALMRPFLCFHSQAELAVFTDTFRQFGNAQGGAAVAAEALATRIGCTAEHPR